MERLVNKKSSLEEQLKTYDNFQEDFAEIKLKKCLKEIKNYENLKKEKSDFLVQKIEKLKILQKKINEFKKLNIKKYEKELKFEYEKIIKEVDNAMGSAGTDAGTDAEMGAEMSADSFKSVKKVIVKNLERSSKFPILNARIQKLNESTNFEYKKRILKNLEKPSEIQILSKNVNFVIEYEILVKESIFKEFVINKICENVIYHFLSNKETNRLDKPEWFFNYIIDKLNENKTMLSLYEHMAEHVDDSSCGDGCSGRNSDGNSDGCSDENSDRNTDRCAHNNTTQNFTTQNNANSVIACVFERISCIIFLRFNEILKSESKQKTDLILHFFEEMKNFEETVKNEFDFEITVKKVNENLLKELKNEINKKMEEIHLQSYKKWFVEYKKMLKEAMNRNFYDVSFNCIISQQIIDNIYIYCELFIKQMRFLSREEIHLLCSIFSEIENLKFFIFELENNFIAENEIKIEILQVNLESLSKFNNENLKLIKNLAKNDIKKILNSLKNFKYVPQKNLISFIVDLTQILNEYKKYLTLGYEILEKCVSEQIDDYLIQNIILKSSFDSNEYLEFKDFFKKVYNLFKYYKNWKTITACKCIEDIFDGRVPENNDHNLFNMIYKNYTSY